MIPPSKSGSLEYLSAALALAAILAVPSTKPPGVLTVVPSQLYCKLYMTGHTGQSINAASLILTKRLDLPRPKNILLFWIMSWLARIKESHKVRFKSRRKIVENLSDVTYIIDYGRTSTGIEPTSGKAIPCLCVSF